MSMSPDELAKALEKQNNEEAFKRNMGVSKDEWIEDVKEKKNLSHKEATEQANHLAEGFGNAKSKEEKERIINSAKKYTSISSNNSSIP